MMSSKVKKLTPPQKRLLQTIIEAGRYGHFIGRGEQQKIRLSVKLMTAGRVKREWTYGGWIYTAIPDEAQS